MSSPETLSAALKQLEGNIDVHRAVSKPGSEKEPVHIRFGDKSHFGEDLEHGDHYATKVNGNNVHIGNYGSFTLGPEGRATWGEMTPEIRATLAILRAKTGYGRFEKAAMEIPYYKQNASYTCGPACARMVLASFGVDLSEKELKNMLKTDEEEGTNEENWGALGNIAGVKTGNMATLDTLDDLRNDGWQIIVSVDSSEDPDKVVPHYVIYQGRENGRVKHIDPNVKDNTSSDENDFMTWWSEDDKGTPPKTSRWYVAMKPDPKLEKEGSIDLPIEEGDILLTGRYKNKRMEVKEIGVDELGQFTVNGQKLLACRIEKLMPKNKQSQKTQEMQKESALLSGGPDWLKKFMVDYVTHSKDEELSKKHNIPIMNANWIGRNIYKAMDPRGVMYYDGKTGKPHNIYINEGSPGELGHSSVLAHELQHLKDIRESPARYASKKYEHEYERKATEAELKAAIKILARRKAGMKGSKGIIDELWHMPVNWSKDEKPTERAFDYQKYYDSQTQELEKEANVNWVPIPGDEGSTMPDNKGLAVMIAALGKKLKKDQNIPDHIIKRMQKETQPGQLSGYFMHDPAWMAKKRPRWQEFLKGVDYAGFGLPGEEKLPWEYAHDWFGPHGKKYDKLVAKHLLKNYKKMDPEQAEEMQAASAGTLSHKNYNKISDWLENNLYNKPRSKEYQDRMAFLEKFSMEKEAFEFTHTKGLAAVAVLTALGAGAGAAYAKRKPLKKFFNKFVEPQITVTSGGGPGVGLRLRGTPFIADIDPTGPGAGVLIPASAASRVVDMIPGRTAAKWAKKLKNAPGSIYAGAEMAGIIPMPHIGIAAGMDDRAKLSRFIKDFQDKPKKKHRSLQKIGEDVRAITNTNSIASGQKIDFDPSEAKKKSENYKKAHVKMDGFDISVENPIGSVRKGKSPDGTEWECPIHADYGYIKGSKGFDKDHVDVTIKPGYKGGAEKIHVVNQVDDKGKFDEHKIVIGATNKNEARNVYNCNYEAGWDGAGSIMEMPMEEFRHWVYSNAPAKGAVEKEASSKVPPSLKGALARWNAPNVPIIPKAQTPVPTQEPGSVTTETKPNYMNTPLIPNNGVRG